MINFNYFSDSFIGVVFPIRFLAFMSGELEHNSTIYGYCVFCSLNISSLYYFRSQHYSRLKLSNLPYTANWDSELDYLKSLDQASKDVVRVYSVHGKLGKMCFGFDPFGNYVATNLRKIISTVSRSKIINLGIFPLYQLESLKDPTNFNRYPITYKYNAVDFCHTLVEGIQESCDSFAPNGSWVSQVYIEIGFRNPKDIMIHPSDNQFKHWSDVFLNRLGINIYRRLCQYIQDKR